jgi:hypothetical protein
MGRPFPPENSFSTSNLNVMSSVKPSQIPWSVTVASSFKVHQNTLEGILNQSMLVLPSESLFKRSGGGQGIVVHTHNPSCLGGGGSWFQTSLAKS